MISVLVVEDERIVAKDLERTLTRLGYDVTGLAASSDQAIASATERCPDLVLMDIRIEGARDGVETAGILRERFQIPIVYLTAFADESTVQRASETEPYGYLVKPFSDSQLRSAIDVALFKHRVDSRLKQRERWFAATLRAISHGVIAADGEGRVTYVNQATEALSGKRAEQVTGQQFLDVIRLIEERTGHRSSSSMERALKVGSVVHLPSHALVTTAPSVPGIDDAVAPIVDENGETLGAVMILHDTGEQQKAYERLAMTDRLAAIEVLTAGVAHEINNPLTYVGLYADDTAAEIEALEREVAAGGPPEDLSRRLRELADAVAQIRHGADRISRIVRDLAMFSRPGAEDRELVDVCSALEWAAGAVMESLSARASLVTHFSSVPPVAANEGRLAQVFVNLLLNAAQSIPVDAAERNEIAITARTDARGWVVASVADTGCGIPPENLKHVFEPFFTTKGPGVGTGLGLSTAHGIVKALGGEIQVHSTLGVGTVVDVLLPPAPADAGSSHDPSMRSTPERRRILVVAEEPVMRQWLVRALGSAHEVQAAAAADASRQLEGGASWDLVFCDLTSGDAAGVSFLEKVQSVAPAMAARSVLVTGNQMSERARTFAEATGATCLGRPCSSDSVRALAQRLMTTRT